MNETEKATLRNQLANIDWDAKSDTAGRVLALKLETIMNILEEEGSRIREASSQLQDGLKTEDEADDVALALDRSASNIAYALEEFDEIRFKLF